MPAPPLIARLSAFRRRIPLDSAWRLLLWLTWIGYAGFVVLLLLARFVVLPNVAEYRGDIEGALSASLAQKVSIGRIEAGWRGLRPRLVLHDFRVRGSDGGDVLSFDEVDAVLAWTSLLHLDLRLYRLSIVAPTLNLRRAADGRLFVGQMPLNTERKGPDFSAWLLDQHQFVVRDASITWQDETRQAPPLALNHVNFRLENRGSRHRFGFTADPPRNMAARLDVRGDFIGNDFQDLPAWRGEAYAELDYADLAVWRQWVDYPLELPAGRGGLRLWLGLGDQGLAYATADVALADVQLRLRGDLPVLAIRRMSGRVGARRLGDAYDVSAKRLALDTRDGVHIAPTDMHLQWTPGSDGAVASGEFSANLLDLDAVVRLADALPLPPELRQRLAASQPRGRLSDVDLNWSAVAGSALGNYRVRARFDNLGLAPQGSAPGFSGLSGSIEGGEGSGLIKIASRNAALQMPQVFPEANIAFATLDVDAAWNSDEAGLGVSIDRAVFRNADARGELHGRYHARAGSAGDIDLTAALFDADARSVWRYMPLAVNVDARNWLKESLLGGRADEARLQLKGDLSHFPFNDGSGIFEVKGRFHGGVVRYAKPWPDIDDVSGTLLFQGSRMVIDGDKGRIYGVALSGVRAEIPNLDTPTPVLVVVGRAAGPSAEFLRFVEASPVGEHIDHVTRDLTAQGSGNLDLKLNLPLAAVAQGSVDGQFHFSGNRIGIAPGLPPLTEANGRVAFTEKSLTLPRGRAVFLGAPMTIDIASGDSGVTLVADGRLDMAALRRESGMPLFDYLSGSSPWRATVKLHGSSPELRVETNLVGIASTLPPPFNKNSLQTLPFRLERKPGSDDDHDQIRATLGSDIRMVVNRARENDGLAVRRGEIGVGDWLPLPDHGLLLAARLSRLDFDFWRRGLAGGEGSGGAVGLPITAVKLRAGEGIAFGHQLNDLTINAARDSDGWGAQVNSREVSGSLAWRGQGAGRLVARLKRLAVVAAAKSGGESGGSLDELPGLDVEAEQTQLHGMDLGRLKLTADNREGRWDAKLDIDNPDGHITGNGTWKRLPAPQQTHLQFNIEARNVDRVLARFGYPDSVRRGTATLQGTVDWNAGPFAIDYPSLTGHLKLEARNGQFAKIEPGAGRLLGLLSLQSLPRRLSLDFRDIFSEGFAFDSIDGEAKVTRGVAETNDLAIDGPAAKILMHGKVDLASETADLRVRVQPAIGQSLAVGYMFANPALGAAAWLANKLLKDPLGHVFAYDYQMTGPWADIKVDKIGAATPPPDSATKAN